KGPESWLPNGCSASSNEPSRTVPAGATSSESPVAASSTTTVIDERASMVHTTWSGSGDGPAFSSGVGGADWQANSATGATSANRAIEARMDGLHGWR